MEREGLEIGLERTIDLGELAEEETEPQVPPPSPVQNREVPPTEEPHKTAKARKGARSHMKVTKKEERT